ncbi:MAG: hypothetical protein R3F42_11650 [Pseudomonadota bacterium]
MAFSWYSRLAPAARAVYRASDRIHTVALPDPAPLQPCAVALQAALAHGDAARVGLHCQRLADGITGQLAVVPVQTRVLSARPHDARGELHGLYEPADRRRRARISVWMRTAQQRRVVAYRTFLRTLLHELCHHLDYEYLGLDDSFHTEGFYRRESALLRQLVLVPAQQELSLA